MGTTYRCRLAYTVRAYVGNVEYHLLVFCYPAHFQPLAVPRIVCLVISVKNRVVQISGVVEGFIMKSGIVECRRSVMLLQTDHRPEIRIVDVCACTS